MGISQEVSKDFSQRLLLIELIIKAISKGKDFFGGD